MSPIASKVAILPRRCADHPPSPAESERREPDRTRNGGGARPAGSSPIARTVSVKGGLSIGFLPAIRPSSWLVGVALMTIGCGTRESPPIAILPAEQPLRKADPVMFAKIEDDVRKVVNDATVRYWPLEYDTDERLVDYLDKVNQQIAAGASEPSKRYLIHMDPKEELDHIRETIRRWTAQTGKDFPATIDSLKADIAHRDPKQTNFPEFHRKFAAELSDFIKLENEESRERRDRMIQANLPAALAPYRQSHPAIVEDFESRFSRPLHRPPASDSSRAKPPPEPRKS